MYYTFSDTWPSYLTCKHRDVAHATQDPPNFVPCVLAVSVFSVLTFLADVSLSRNLFMLSTKSPPVSFPILSFPLLSFPLWPFSRTEWLHSQSGMRTPASVESRGWRQEAGDFLECAFFPCCGVITVQAVLLLFLSPLCLCCSYSDEGTKGREYSGSPIMAVIHHSKNGLPLSRAFLSVITSLVFQQSGKLGMRICLDDCVGV